MTCLVSFNNLCNIFGVFCKTRIWGKGKLSICSKADKQVTEGSLNVKGKTE